MARRRVDEATLDEGIAETFPASDPVSVSITRLEPRDDASPPSPGSRAGDGWAGFIGGALLGIAVGLAIDLCRQRGR